MLVRQSRSSIMWPRKTVGLLDWKKERPGRGIQDGYEGREEAGVPGEELRERQLPNVERTI